MKNITLKHNMHRARDQEFVYEVDQAARKIVIQCDEIDTMLLTWFLQQHLSRDLGGKSLSSYDIELHVGSARFGLKLVERDFEPKQETLVLRPL